MKHIASISVALFLSISSLAQPRVDVQTCGEGIFRVRISESGEFRESLLERYGILKTDWDTNSSFTLDVDETTMTFKVCDKEGRTIVDGISFLGYKAPEVCGMNAEIKKRFVGIKAEVVLGDTRQDVPETDRAEGGDPAFGSIISVKLHEGERLYGGGSTSREHINHRGEFLRMHTTYQRSEIPMPFMMSSEGWGIFNNTTLRNYWDVGATDPSSLRIYTPCPDADFYIILGESMPRMLDLYTQLTGRTYILPKWAYGFCFGPHEREDQWDILSDAVNFRASDVPCDLFWLEPQWMERRYDFSTSKKVNTKMFDFEPYWKADQYPKSLHNRLFVGKLRNMGFHLGLWLCEDYDLSLVEEDEIAAREGRELSGQEHWMDHLGTFMDYGVDGFKLDPARTINEHPFRKYHNGRTDLEMHNLDQVLLGKQMREFTRKHTGRRSWHHYCGGWTGSQAFSAANSGDNGGGKTALFDQLNLGMSGFMNLTCDVMSVGADQEMQSLHFGTLLPWLQVNSWYSMMQPFYYNEEQKTIYRNTIKLRYELIPYIYSNALEGFLTGMPITRAMPLVYPDDRNCDDMWDQFMSGPSLLVGVFTDTIYLPEGTWFDAWTGARIDSNGETKCLPYPKDRAGLLFVKGGAIIPCHAKQVQYIGKTPFEDYRLRVYPVEGESEYVLRDCDAESYGYESGKIASRRLTCSQNGKKVKIGIDATQGEFENMPASTTWELVVRLEGRPKRVAVDGKKIKEWEYTDGFLAIQTGSLGKDESRIVQITL